MAAGTAIRRLGRPGDLGWVVMVHGEICALEFCHDTSLEALVAQLVAAYATTADPAREAAWIAEVDGDRAGCVFCVRDKQDGTARLRILLVDPAARGRHLGRQLVDQCVTFAQDAGYRRMVLWASDSLTSAARIYRAAGFRPAAQEPHHAFGAGRTYELDLRSQPGTADRMSRWYRSP